MSTRVRRVAVASRLLSPLVVGALLVSAIGCAKESASPDGGGAATTPVPKPSDTAAPLPTAWAAAPNPCSLLTDAEIAQVTHFEVSTERRDITAPSGDLLPNCFSQNRTSQIKGGYFTVTILPPGSAMLNDRSQYSAIEEMPGVGKQALLAHHSKALGAGTNIGLVDMGNGGFLIGVQVYSDTTADQMRSLITQAAARWKV